uniref:Multiple epidermal growth factor-like domains 10 n=1 Tax=Magallana gigas TaxID=29159 RepID=K1PKW7_MAGGI
MDRTESGKQCVQGNSTVFVKCYGLHASYFPDKKNPGAVCRNMLDKVLNRLGPKDKGLWCFTNNSEDSNFMESCDLPLQECDHSRYGANCSEVCGHCLSGSCRFVTGACVGGCIPGWQGEKCQDECDPGRYGANCSEVCGHCLSGSCRFVTGACVGGCIPGWQGEKWQEGLEIIDHPRLSVSEVGGGDTSDDSLEPFLRPLLPSLELETFDVVLLSKTHRPPLEHACTMWDPHTVLNIQKLEASQRRSICDVQLLTN